MTPRLHPIAWATWLVSAMIVVLISSNPLYHATAALSALIVYATIRPGRRSGLDALLLLGWGFAALSIPLNLIAGSTGSHELFTLPSLTLPGWLGSVTFGGVVTAESLMYAVDQALSLGAIISIVCAFNAGVDHFQLLKLTPPGLAQLGVVVSVGLLLIPETLARTESLREARVARGYSSRLTPGLVFPLLSDALERAVERAESLDARGFGSLAAQTRANESGIALAGLLIAACGAFGWYYAEDARVWAAVALAAGAVLVIGVAHRQASRGVARRVLIAPMVGSDLLVVAASAISASLVVAARVAGVGDVSYLPFPELAAPEFHPLIGAAIALLLAPAFATGRRT